MCRFLAYFGQPILMEDLLFKPTHSLVKQSTNATERCEPLNGDGFGVAWYNPEINNEPALFTSIQPAWNNRNLVYLSSKVRTNCFFAHIRAASEGGISEYNCHPFHYKKFLLMHNGGIADFKELKRHLRHHLSDELYSWIKGQTDSEHLAALVLNNLQKHKKDSTPENIAAALKESFTMIVKWQEKYGLSTENYLNFAVTDGKSIVASRYVSSPHHTPSSLHYAQRNGSFVLASEKLEEHSHQWRTVKPHHILIIDEEHNITEQPIEAK